MHWEQWLLHSSWPALKGILEGLMKTAKGIDISSHANNASGTSK
jgi:hypothetical protein